MIGGFKKPNNVWLCLFSILWLLIAVWFGSRFVINGKIAAASLLGVWGLASLGLWFQSRAAARVLIGFACIGILFSLLKIGSVPLLRVITPIFWAAWAIMLLVEYLQQVESE